MPWPSINLKVLLFAPVVALVWQETYVGQARTVKQLPLLLLLADNRLLIIIS
jgi:hypothetical protein